MGLNCLLYRTVFKSTTGGRCCRVWTRGRLSRSVTLPFAPAGAARVASNEPWNRFIIYTTRPVPNARGLPLHASTVLYGDSSRGICIYRERAVRLDFTIFGPRTRDRRRANVTFDFARCILIIGEAVGISFCLFVCLLVGSVGMSFNV